MKNQYEPKIEKLSETSFAVQSESNAFSDYRVEFEHGVFICTCPHFVFRGVECKHILATKKKYGELEPIQEEVRSQKLSEMML